jgi:hypothetical protein
MYDRNDADAALSCRPTLPLGVMGGYFVLVVQCRYNAGIAMHSSLVL